MTKAYVEDITQEKFNKCIEDLVSAGQAIVSPPKPQFF